MTKQLPIFVYGTLRKGCGNYRLLEGTTYKEDIGLINGAIYPVISGAFPCLIDEEGVVVGELMYVKPEIYEDVMARCDMLEGYRKGDTQSMYVREKIDVTVYGGEVEAWVYYWNRMAPLTDKIQSGCWKTFELMKRRV